MRKALLILLVTGFLLPIELNGQLRFNEIIALNSTGQINPLTGEVSDWIEIYNSGTEEINISHYFLSDRPRTPFMWSFPQNTIIPADDFLMVWADGTGDTINGLHTNFKLDVAGESLVLYSVDRVFIDSLSYPRMYEDVSYGYWGGDYYFLRKPSWKEGNLYSDPYRVSGKVQIDPPAGIYTPGTTISIGSSAESGTIRYTLDGSEPDANDPEYSGELTANETLLVRARQFEEGATAGEVTTATYIIHEAYTLPVISLATDPKGLWSDEEGIYISGTNGITGNCSPAIARNWNQPWEKPMSFEYFDREGEIQMQLNGGVKIHGGCSRSHSMKSLGIYARSIYGESLMNHPFFREKDLAEFESLILRNGGNDFNYAFIRDGVIQATVHPVMDLDHQAYEPVQVYLNGEYWGIHNLREKVNEHWVSSNYGIPSENLDFLKNQWEIFTGDRNTYDELISYLEENSLDNAVNYDWVEKRVDINSYQDYLITQLFFANRDWPGNNQKYWRDRVDSSKWRWILFDLEFSLGLYDFDPSLNMFAFATKAYGTDWPNPAWSTLIIRRLLENEDFKEQFLAKYMMHLNTTFAPQRVIGIIDSLQNQIYEAYPSHIERWGHMSMAKWESWVEELRDFSRERPDHVWNNMRSYFSLGNILTMKVAPSGVQGIITANGVDLPSEGLSGRYAAKSQLHLNFIPNPGYCFSHWEASTGNSRSINLLDRGSEWKYQDSGVRPDGWREKNYDDSSWPSGAGILGYGDDNESTTLDYGGDDQNKTVSYYFRKSLEIEDISLYDSFEIGLVRDDGAVVYINGTEVLRDNMPEGTIAQDIYATTYAGGEDETTYFIFSVDKAYFQSGVNTFAIEVHQSSATSSDLKFDLELTGTIITETGNENFMQNPLILNPETDISIKAVAEIEQLDLDLHINEIMASNMGSMLDEYGKASDWIEIYNRGDSHVNMAGLYLTDDLEDPTKWRIPHGTPGQTTIDPDGYLLFFADQNPILGPRHLAFKLSSSGESLGMSYLSGNTLVWIDSISFPEQYANISSGFYPDGEGDWIELDQSPGHENARSTLTVQSHQALKIALYPNPTRDLLNVSISNPNETMGELMEIHIYDLTGRRMMSQQKSVWGNIRKAQLDVSALPEAVYLLVVETPAGAHAFKFVKTDR